jgi:hypothetical protein
MRRLAFLLIVGSLAVAGCGGGADDRRGEDPKLLYDRVWIDHLPEKHTDYIQAMFVLGARPVGVFQKASSYDLHLEAFFYAREGTTQLKYRFPQTEKKGDVRYKITACNDQPPFDLCLELSRNPWGGPKKYYGQREDSDDARLVKLKGELVQQLP